MHAGRRLPLRRTHAARPHGDRRRVRSLFVLCIHTVVRRGEHTAQQFESELKINRFIAHEIFHSVVFVVVVALAHTRTHILRPVHVRPFVQSQDRPKPSERDVRWIAGQQSTAVAEYAYFALVNFFRHLRPGLWRELGDIIMRGFHVPRRLACDGPSTPSERTVASSVSGHPYELCCW